MSILSDLKRGRIVSQSLLTTITDPRPWWRAYVTSAVVHTAAIVLILAIFVPAAREIYKRKENFVLIAPPLPSYRAKVMPSRHIQAPRPVITKVLPVVIALPKRVSSPVVKPPEIVLAKDLPPKDVPAVEPVHPVPVPKPEVHTGIFQSSDLAKGPQTPKQLKLGGFGDPNGVPASSNPQHSALAPAGVGSFDLPVGDDKGGAGGQGRIGVRQTSFDGGGDGSKVASGSGGHSGGVRTGGFGDSAALASNQAESAKPAAPTMTPVDILYKPKPVYTAEARSLKLEGQVSLEVVFLATGSVHVIRIVRGLGHGLDEAAQAAASQVRFHPATRAGVPVDTSATIYITFELA